MVTVLFFFMQSFSLIAEKNSSPENEDAFYSSGDTLLFSGFKWVTKESNERHTGPGRNFFAGGKENVWIDEQGRMHIRMTHRNGRWYCAEARLVESLGYGQYIFRVEANPAKLDKNIVVGFFTYDYDDTLNHHREIDLEFSTWGKDKDLNSQYVIQPFEVTKNSYRFQTDISKTSEQVIGWKKNKVSFSSSIITTPNDSVVSKKYCQWSYKPEKDIKQHLEKFSMNIWLFKADFPSDYTDYEFVVSKFQFIPYKFEKFRPTM